MQLTETAELILDIFRPERLIRWSPSKNDWVTLPERVAPAVKDVIAHWRGKSKYGAYPGEHTRLVVVDIDAHTAEDAELAPARARGVAEWCLDLGAEPLLIRSPSGGFHAYVVLDKPGHRDDINRVVREDLEDRLGDLWVDGKGIDLYPMAKGLRYPLGDGQRLVHWRTLEPIYEDRETDIQHLHERLLGATIPRALLLGSDYVLPTKAAPQRPRATRKARRRGTTSGTAAAVGAVSAAPRCTRGTVARGPIVSGPAADARGADWTSQIREIETSGAVITGSTGAWDTARQIANAHMLRGDSAPDSLRAVKAWANKALDEREIPKILPSVEKHLERLEARIERGELRPGAGAPVPAEFGVAAEGAVFRARDVTPPLLRSGVVVEAIIGRTIDAATAMGCDPCYKDRIRQVAHDILESLVRDGVWLDSRCSTANTRVRRNGARVRVVQAAREALLKAGFLYKVAKAKKYKVGARFGLLWDATIELHHQLGVELPVIEAAVDAAAEAVDAVAVPEAVEATSLPMSKTQGPEVVVEADPDEFDDEGRASARVIASALLSEEVVAAMIQRAEAEIRGDVGDALFKIRDEGWIPELSSEVAAAIGARRMDKGYGLDFWDTRQLRAGLGLPRVTVVAAAATEKPEVLLW